MNVRWLLSALLDLEEIRHYIATHNPRAATAVGAAIEVGVEGLADHPRRGRPGRASETRELVISPYPYIVVYRITHDVVEVLAVRQGARRWPRGFD